LENTTCLGVGKKIEIYVAKNIVDLKHNHGPLTTSKIEANNKIKKSQAPLRRKTKEIIHQNEIKDHKYQQESKTKEMNIMK
jgi:hypothetical protein